jgi:hypothetical protein
MACANSVDVEVSFDARSDSPAHEGSLNAESAQPISCWQPERPPLLAQDFPGDRAAGERARDVWYERWTNGGRLPAFDAAASPADQKAQISARSSSWRKALRQYHDRHVRSAEDEAARKRRSRAETFEAAVAGASWAVARMDAELERGRHRRELARQEAAKLQAITQREQEWRRQSALIDDICFKAASCALQEVGPPPAYTSNSCENHYRILDVLAEAFWAAKNPPDGTEGWHRRRERSVTEARAASEAVRTALLEWDYKFDPDYVEPDPQDRYGYYGYEPLHPWARAPLPPPSMLLHWLRRKLDSLCSAMPLQPSQPTEEQCEADADDEEVLLAHEMSREDEASFNDDLLLLLEQTLETGLKSACPPPVLDLPWRELPRSSKAAARLLGFSFKNWHKKVSPCSWSALCEEERASATFLGFVAQTWDAQLPVCALIIPPTPTQLANAQAWISSQLACAQKVEVQFGQSCQHPFELYREHPDRLEPLLSDPNHPYAAALHSGLYDTHSSVKLPAFVRSLRSRKSKLNPQGYCRMHCAPYALPVQPAGRLLPPWADRKCCSCVLGDAGLHCVTLEATGRSARDLQPQAWPSWAMY